MHQTKGGGLSVRHEGAVRGTVSYPIDPRELARPGKRKLGAIRDAERAEAQIAGRGGASAFLIRTGAGTWSPTGAGFADLGEAIAYLRSEYRDREPERWLAAIEVVELARPARRKASKARRKASKASKARRKARRK